MRGPAREDCSMTDVFGLPITVVMIVLLVLLALVVAVVAGVWARNPILFSLGVRNIPRRRAQSVLIVLGLMLSTVIVSAAFATGDTVNHSITNDTYEKLGHVDEVMQVQSNSLTPSLTNEQVSPTGYIPNGVTDALLADLNGNDNVDGILGGLRFPAPVTATDLEPAVTLPQAVIIGLNPRQMDGFTDDVVLTTGSPYDISQLRPNEALANASLQAALGLTRGQHIDIWVDRNPRTVTVVGFVEDRYLTGWTQGEPKGLLVPLATAQKITNQTGLGFVAISNAGGVRDSLGATTAALRAARTSVQSSRFEIDPIKRDRIDRAKELGSNMTAIFVVLGLFSIAAGLLLVFLILVMLAAERRPEMGMARAVGMKRRQLIESFMAEGMAYSLTSALAGAAIGVAVSIGMTRAMAYIFNRFDVSIVFHVTPQSLVIAYCLGVILTFLTVTFSAWRVSNLSIVAAIREVNETAPAATGLRSAIMGGAMISAGVTLTAVGIRQGEAYQFGAGASLVLIGAAGVARALGRPERLVFTTASIAVLVLWVLVAGDNLHAVTGTLNAGLETFFVGGVLMVTAATFAVVYNAELLLGSIRSIGVVFPRVLPAVRTSIAYPLANKLRTGMTIAMLSLVVFALVMISTMNLNFRKLFLSADSRGGFDIQVSALPTNAFSSDANGNRLGPLGEALDRGFYDTREIAAISQVFVANPRTTVLTELGPNFTPLGSNAFRVLGADDIFLDQNTIGLQARAEGYATDRDVWDAVKKDANNAIVDGSVVPGINYANLTESRFTLKDYKSGTRTFTPFAMLVNDTSTKKQKTLRIIGIMNRGPSETYAGMWVNTEAAGKAFPTLFSRYYIKLAPGADAIEEANRIETTLAQYGVSATSIQQKVEEQQALSSAFFYLVQGFMALGLTVGLAALGVIAFRTVVERRQQIGLMRAIGFSRTNIALSFMLESAFVALLGIVNGIWLALLLASRLLASEQFSTAGFTTFYIPWLQIALFAVLVFVASVLTTVIPSRQASGIPIAEALRYE
jgi:putative ABC transport system permease protein